jgi:IS30 family transposase
MAQIREVAYPLLCQGLSPATIWMANSNRLPCSERSFYRYVHQGFFDDICLLDLPAAARYAPRKTATSPTRTNIAPKLLEGRKFEDFLCLDTSVQENCVEMDTVMGAKGSVKSILTILWRRWLFQVMLLLERHTAERVVAALDGMEAAVGEDNFPEVALTDRGCEFADVLGIERSCMDGTISRCALYFCDPRRSDQKARCENNHRLIRRILPKGTGFDGLTAEDLSLVMSHVNSMPRKSLGGKSPMELAMGYLPDQFFAKYGLKLIPANQIILKPRLLQAR